MFVTFHFTLQIISCVIMKGGVELLLRSSNRYQFFLLLSTSMVFAFCVTNFIYYSIHLKKILINLMENKHTIWLRFHVKSRLFPTTRLSERRGRT